MVWPKVTCEHAIFTSVLQVVPHVQGSTAAHTLTRHEFIVVGLPSVEPERSRRAWGQSTEFQASNEKDTTIDIRADMYASHHNITRLGGRMFPPPSTVAHNTPMAIIHFRGPSRTTFRRLLRSYITKTLSLRIFVRPISRSQKMNVLCLSILIGVVCTRRGPTQFP
jgi:hypothetical protein